MIWLNVSTGLGLQEFRSYEDIATLVADFMVSCCTMEYVV